MIAVENLALRAGAFALDGVSFRVETGQYAVLMGKTGSGKTTLLEAVAGLKPVRAGHMLLMGHDVTALKAAERGVGYVPQDLALFPTLTVREHLEFAPDVRRWARDAVAERVTELAALLGLGHLLDRRPEGLSGGESQRVALGRALSFRPRSAAAGRAAQRPGRRNAAGDVRPAALGAAADGRDGAARHPQPRRGQGAGRPAVRAQGRGRSTRRDPEG